MPRQGDDFHRLVEHLERAVSGQEGVTIESPKYLPDKITGELREHDIVLTYHSPLRQLVVAIECRDRSRRVTVGQVEEFHTKCRDTGVNKGIIVASGGFGRPARMKATHYGIDCLTLAQVGQVDWCAQSKIVIRRRDPKHVHLEIGLPLSLEDKTWRLIFRRADGEVEEIDVHGRPDNLVSWVWPQVPDPGSELSGAVHVEITNLQDFYLVDEEGTEHPVKRLSLDITYEAVETASPLTFYRYGAELDKPVYETMVTDMETFGNIKGRIMLIRDEEMQLRLQLMQEQGSTTTDQAAEPPEPPERGGSY